MVRWRRLSLLKTKIPNRGGKRLVTGPVREKLSHRAGFTLTELLIVVAIIALLMSVLMPAVRRAQRQAKAVTCQVYLRQWAHVFALYTQDNNGFFVSGSSTNPAMGDGNWWIEPLQVYYKDETEDAKIRLCPIATIPRGVGRTTGRTEAKHRAWKNGKGYLGSYGPNGWICNHPAGQANVWGRPTKDGQGKVLHWKTPLVKGTNNIPVFTGMWWVDAWPRHTDQPAPYEGWPGDTVNLNEMNRVCVNRHDGFVNGVFADSSGRRIGLKELWRLKWHRQFDTTAPPVQWPAWMRRFRDY